MKIIYLSSLSSLLLLQTTHAAVTIAAVGDGTGYDSTGVEATSYYTTGVSKLFDVSGDDRYGTDGYLIFGGDSNNNSADYGVNVGTYAELVPTFVDAFSADISVTLVRNNSSQTAMDDPDAAVEGDDFALAGYIMNNGTAGTTDLPMVSFSITDSDATTFRLGVLSANTNGTQFHPTALRLSFDDADVVAIDPTVNITTLPTLTSSLGMVFFDVTIEAGTTGTFTLAASENTNNPIVAGLTFDVDTGFDPDSDNDNLLDSWELSKTTAPGNLTDLTGLKDGSVNPGTADSGDFDNDGLTDLEEFDLAVTNVTYPNLDPTLADTDADGRNDGDEVNGVTSPQVIAATDPTDPDSDGDGIYDGAETNTGVFVSYDFGSNTGDAGTDPTLTDSDSDELDDGFEATNSGLGYDPNVDDSATDFDGDASVVSDEISNGTDVLLPDTDNDGFYDGAETNSGTFVSYDYGSNTGDTGTDPLNSDTDGDDVLDGVESNTGTFVDATDSGSDPHSPNSDTDAFDDGQEVFYGSDPNVDNATLPNTVSGYTATGGDWLKLGLFDIDGDGSLGTDGFIFYGAYTGGQKGGEPYSVNVASAPAYLVSHAQGADFNAVVWGFGGSGYGSIDNPNLLDGSEAVGGFIVADSGDAGSVSQVMSFEIGSLTVGQVVRVGMLGGIGGNEDGRFDPTELRISGPGGYAKGALDLEINPGGGNAGWLFFEIDTAGTYTVFATHRAANGVGIGGLTFDSVANIADADPDSDGDDLPDGWELAITQVADAPFSGNLTDLNGLFAGSGPGADTGNFDGDGYSDLEELGLAQGGYQNISPILADTDGDGQNDDTELNNLPPTDPTVFTVFVTDAPVLNVVSAANGTDLEFSWISEAGLAYDLRSSTSLDSDPTTWSIVAAQGDLSPTVPNATLTIARPVASQTFYVLTVKVAP
ncbi:MAG: hypothetical protein ACSHYA_19300 [Opitutaceae bacterium]